LADSSTALQTERYFSGCVGDGYSMAAASNIPLRSVMMMPLSTSLRIQNGVTEVSEKSSKSLYLNPFT
jgi:hypothetical protein